MYSVVRVSLIPKEYAQNEFIRILLYIYQWMNIYTFYVIISI